MQDDSLNYRSSGVDVLAHNRAGVRIKAYVQDTFGAQILTRAGLFGAAVSLKESGETMKRPLLSGSLGFGNSSLEDELASQIVRSCRANLSPSARPVAFLDYIAAAKLDPARAVGLVGAFSRILSRDPKIPLVGGETAEMPGVFRENRWEVVGALFAVQEASELHHDPASSCVEFTANGERVDLQAGAALSHPALVFSMDGVGTKTKLGVMAGNTSGLSIDIIHHSLNDILCQGAQGLATMMYVGCHHREEALIQPIIRTAGECCRANGMKILDLIVEEKPEIYLPGEIDLCAAIAGIVDAAGLIQGSAIAAGDQLIGLHSSGLHTNGYSLARKALLERGGLRLDQHLAELGCSLGEALLEPHRNYAPVVLPLLEDTELAPAVRGIAHITGGGLKDNLVRILPEGLAAEIRLNSWQPPPIFELIRRIGNIGLEDP
jgi:phosphoribosylformylglycinamidine cyclo-ligase